MFEGFLKHHGKPLKGLLFLLCVLLCLETLDGAKKGGE
jgi:hypothetical protein